jgi:hypothetical protein
MWPLWKSPLRKGGAFAALAIAASMVPHQTAQAQVACNTLPKPVYGQGGSAHKPFLAKVGAAWRKAAEPRTIVYQDPGACIGIYSLLDGTKLTGTGIYWEADGTEKTCDLPITGETQDFAAMGVFATSCAEVEALPADIGDFQAAINSWNLVVPTASSQQSISAEAVYFAFGFGTAGGAVPWTDESQLIVRNATSAAQIAIALASGLPPDKFIGVDAKTNSNTITLLSTSPKPEAAIGFVSGEVADANREKVRTLAFQARDQTCGYWPDSSATEFDKRPVRYGQYFLWSTTHFFAKTNGAGEIADPDTKAVIDVLTGKKAGPPEVNVLDITIANGNIPPCAMNVWRDGDLEGLYSQPPEEPCNCYYEEKATGSTSCDPCTADADCTGEGLVCSYGFCEVK